MIDNPDSIFTPANPPVPPPKTGRGSRPPSQDGPGGPPKSNRKALFILIGVALIAGMCLCLSLAAGLVLFAVNTSSQEGQGSIIDEYMNAMASGDAEYAYAMLSSHAKELFSMDDLQTESQAEAFIRYAGYQGYSVDSRRLVTRSGSAEGTPFTIEEETLLGTISYRGGEEVQFRAILEKEDGVWMLFELSSITRPQRGKQG